MAVYKTTDGRWVASYNGQKVYTTSQSKAMAAYADLKASTSTSSSTSSSTSTKTSSSSSSSSTPTSSGYVVFQTSSGPAYFQQTSSGLSAVNDPTILKQLQSGSLKATTTTVDSALASTKSSGGTASNVFSSSVATPSLVPSLSTAVAPTTTTEINTAFPSLQVPDLGPSYGDITGAMAGTVGLQTFMDIFKKQQEDQLKLEMQRQQEQKSLLDKFMGSVESPAEARQRAMDEIGLEPDKYFAQQQAGIKEIETLTNEYNRVLEAKDLQIAQTNDKMASMNFINNQTAQIERNAAPQLQRISAQINAKAATLQALQGNFNEARAYVNQAVNDAVAEYKFRADMYSELYKMNEDAFANLSSIYDNAYKSTLAIAQMAYEEQRADKEMVGELLLKYPTAGIDIYNDSYAEAIRKASGVAGTSGTPDLTADQRNYLFAVQGGYQGSFAEWVGKDGGSNSIPYAEMMQAAIDSGASPEEAARSAAIRSEADGIPVDQTTLSKYIQYAKTLTKTPAPQPIVPVTNTVSSYGGNLFSNSWNNAVGMWDSTKTSLADLLFGD